MSTRLAKRWTVQDLAAFHKFHRDIKEDTMRRERASKKEAKQKDRQHGNKPNDSTNK